VTGQQVPGGRTEPTIGLDRLADAEGGLRSIQDVLRAAEAGRADDAEVSSVIADYWRTHRPVLREAGAAVLELLRLQTLDALYRWREQVNAQLVGKPRDEAARDDASES